MLRIDPAVRPVWRSVDAVQFGVDPVVAVLDPVPPGAEGVLAALVAGSALADLHRIGREAGLRSEAVGAVLEAVGPALLDGPLRGDALRVALDGPDDLVALLRRLLLRDGAPAPAAASDVVLVAAHHLIPPAAAIRHLASDRRHLPVVFGDQAVVVGPLVEPGRTPCLRCAEEHRLDDPARRTVATQLLRRRGSRTASSARTALRTALLIGDGLEALADGEPSGFEGVAVRLAPDGSISRAPARWHERCGCRFPAA